MKTFIAFFLSLALLLGSLVLAKPSASSTEADIERSARFSAIYWNILAKTADHYNSMGARRKLDTFKKYLDSSYRVANMFDDFPAADFVDRWTRNFAYGSVESGYMPNYVHVNIPGKSYPGIPGMTVKQFSVDYGLVGVNEINVEWAYTAASCIQNGEPIPKAWRDAYGPGTIAQFRTVHIPPGLKLLRIDLNTAKQAKRAWQGLVKKGVDPNRMKIGVRYLENTDDWRDSVLIYRLLIEMDRRNRGWRWRSWDTDLYRICQAIVWRYPGVVTVPASK